MQPGVNHAPLGTDDADFSEQTTVPVKDQIAQYLKDHERFTSKQLVLIEGGANDIFFQLAAAQAAGTAAAQEAAIEAITRSATDLANLVASVVAKGATHVVVFNVPDIGTTPQGVASPDHGQSLTQISQLFNKTLAGVLEQQNRKTGGPDFNDKIIILDDFTFIDDIVANFQTYGFKVSNTAMACDLSAQISRATERHLNNPSVFGQAVFCSPKTFTIRRADETFMFADSVHPTTHLNALVAEFVERQIAAKRW